MTVDTTDLTPAESYWAEVTQNADTVEGADLEKGANLIGVPFCITKAVFREGDFLNQGVTGWYVSLEALIAPAREVTRAYQRGRIPKDTVLSVEPGESIIFNEGGTGVYRQVIAYLEAKGLWDDEKQQKLQERGKVIVHEVVEAALGIEKPNPADLFDHTFEDLPEDLLRQETTRRTDSIGQDPTQIGLTAPVEQVPA